MRFDMLSRLVKFSDNNFVPFSVMKFWFLLLLTITSSEVTHASSLKSWEQLWVWPGKTVRLRGFASAAEACKPYDLSRQTGPDTANCAAGWYVSTVIENCPFGDNSGQGLVTGLKCNATCDLPKQMVEG